MFPLDSSREHEPSRALGCGTTFPASLRLSFDAVDGFRMFCPRRLSLPKPPCQTENQRIPEEPDVPGGERRIPFRQADPQRPALRGELLGKKLEIAGNTTLG